MKPTLLVHIDYGSQGSAGLYIERLLKAPTTLDEVEAFVHHDYSGDRGAAAVHQIFGRRSATIKPRTLQGLYKWIDLYSCFFRIWMQLRRRSRSRRMVMVVSLFQSFKAYEWLFKRLREVGTLIVIVHDAVEHKHSYPSFVMCNRDRLLKYADRLLVHSEDSRQKLSYLRLPIAIMPFPPMRPIVSPPACIRLDESPIKFLFIGHLRVEKGVARLASVWRQLPEHILRRSWLTIAGSMPDDIGLDLSGLPSATVSIGFLKDEEFIKLIAESDCIVFPYVGGTNSGVYSIAGALGKPSIVSSLPVFLESPFIRSSFQFGTDAELTNLIIDIVSDHQMLREKTTVARQLISDVESDFNAFFESNDVFSPD